MRNCDRSGKKMRRRSRHRQPGMPGSCQFRMMVRGGAVSGGPVWPTISCSGEAVISAAATRSSTPAAAGIAAKGARQNWLQNSTLPSSPGGHLSQSPMPPPAIAAGDMASAMLVALAPCATVPAANTANRTIANMRASLSMTFHASPFLRHVQIQAVAASTSRIVKGYGCRPATCWPDAEAGVRKPPGEEPAGWRARFQSLWGFDVFAWSAAAELMPLADGNDDVDERARVARAAYGAAWSLQAGRFRRGER